MIQMKYLIVTLSLILTSCASLPKNDPGQEEWRSLFNGEDLSGWDIKIRGHELNDNYQETFEVDNGLLSVNYDNYGDFNETFGHLFYEQPYGYYRLRAEYRFIGDQVKGGPGWAYRNNGLMLHSQSASSMALDQDFPISIEVQLLGGNGTDERSTMNLCTPGTHVFMEDKLFIPHCTNSTSSTYHGDQWVSVEVLVEGHERFTHFVEGERVMTYTKPQIGGGVVNDFDPAAKKDGSPLSSGYIAIQAESHPIQFRKIELLNLEGCMDPKAKNYKSYYISDKRSDCTY